MFHAHEIPKRPVLACRYFASAIGAFYLEVSNVRCLMERAVGVAAKVGGQYCQDVREVGRRDGAPVAGPLGKLSHHVAAFMMASVASNDMHAFVSLMSNHMPTAMMAAEASHNMLSSVCRFRTGSEADRSHANPC